MHRSLLLPLIFLAGCTSHAITSSTLSDAEIADIQSRVEARYPDLSSEKTRAVTELVVRALDNMVPIKGGTFMMGEFKIPCEPGSEQLCYSDFNRDNDYAHTVTLDDYAIAKFETTMADFDLFRALRGSEPYEQGIRESEGGASLFIADKPAWTRNWDEPQAYCLWVGELADRDVSLPSEAQWEFAARNRGKNVLYATDNGSIDRGRNYRARGDFSGTHPVGKFPPNPLGLYDMSGNTSEWVRDWYASDYYSSSPLNNPAGPMAGNSHVLRGGSFADDPRYNTTLLRIHEEDLGFYSEMYGFRCGLDN
ncbi:formylglycine-generating enzyme family protein [Marinobacter sp. C2H3]|uniref:formylglycine-generating enzyme family protein n=1 Tax=Marinobacter sp. C2H3 TaxID=3119003 RepID=UPI00300F5107